MKAINAKKLFVEIVALLYIVLFVYAAVSKLMDFQNFRVQIAQSPLLTTFASLVAVAVIALELLISLLLSFPAWRKAGLYAALALMVLFSLYIYMILTYSPFVPCSCGGILEDMGWIQHLIFNIFFCLLAIAALYCIYGTTKKAIKSVTIGVVSLLAGCVAVIFTLYYISESRVHYNNDFVRRFPPFPAERAKVLDLGYDSYYFAGNSGDTVYLGNTSAPALVSVVDPSLATPETFNFTITDTLFTFRNVQLRVAPPYFYLFDGTVPCVFRGSLADKNAVLQTAKLPGFTSAAIMDSTHLLIRSLSSKREHLLMKVNIKEPSRRTANESLLQKQQDGIFDTDGTFHYDPVGKRMAYVYYYRNQYIIADDQMQLIARANTIDTTSRARIETEYVKKKKQRKFSAPPNIVNRITALHRNLLFVNSTLPGKFESQEMWKNANVVDVYDVVDKSYLMSFYVYKVDGGAIDSMMITDNYLYIMMGTKIILYRLNPELKKHFRRT